MVETSSIKFGSRVKVSFKAPLTREREEFKGEVYDIPTNNTLHLIGYLEGNPTKLMSFKLDTKDIISIGGTRLPKYLSELLTSYIANLKAYKKSKKAIGLLQDEKEKQYAEMQKLKKSLPKKYSEHTKSNVTPETVARLIFDGVNSNLKNEWNIATDATLVGKFDIATKLMSKNNLTVIRHHGELVMSDYTEKDVVAHLKSINFPIPNLNNMGKLNTFFDIEQRFLAFPSDKNDFSFGIEYTVYLKVKKTVVKEDMKTIIALLKKFDTAINKIKI